MPGWRVWRKRSLGPRTQNSQPLWLSVGYVLGTRPHLGAGRAIKACVDGELGNVEAWLCAGPKGRAQGDM